MGKPGAGGSHLKSLLLRRQKSGGTQLETSTRQIVPKTLSRKKHFTKKRLAEWLKL
jgi:hypothetical protein